MHCTRLVTTAVLVLLSAVPPAPAQPRPGAADLPISRIVLFSSGVGYFQRNGEVDGNGRIDLQFHTQDINDLLKSLVLQDAGGGRVSTVSYDSRDPIEKTLKSFAIDLTENPSIGQLLNQVRGERVEVLSRAEEGKATKPAPLTGTIVGVQKVKKPVGKDQVIETDQLDLLTTDGLQNVGLDQVQRVKFLKPELEQEFRKALEVLATAHDKLKKTVSLNFTGNGKRSVRVGYVTESPIWKTSYRVGLEKGDKAFLQGWAIVENTSDEDWNQVGLALVSGRPISFQMDLYDPLYVPRPVVELELFASLRPQVYGGEMLGRALLERKATGFGGGAPGQFGAIAAPAAPPAEPMPGLAGRQAGTFSALGKKEELADRARKSVLDFRQGVANAAIATELGEYFQYQIEHPVSLARQKSALLPIVNGPVEASKVSIYNESVHAKFPLHGLRLKNTTGLHLMQGPVTIFDGNSYAGDARIADLQPNETRLVSYAVDLGTEVAPEMKPGEDNLVTVKITKGILQATHKLKQTKLYTVKNRSEHARLVLVEHPYRSDWNLVEPKKPAERSRDVYRFEVKAETNKPVQLGIVEENIRRNDIILTNIPDDTIRFYIRATVVSAMVKEALQRALKLKGDLAETQVQTQREEQVLKDIEQDQARMRANMERVPPTSEAYKRYLKKFDEQETEIERRRDRIKALRETADGQRKTYETFLATLTVE